MNRRSDNKVKVLLVAVLVVVAAGVGVWAVVSMRSSGESRTRRPHVDRVDPGLLTWRQVLAFDTGLSLPSALTVAGETICVAGDRTLVTFAPDGKRIARQALGGEVSCLAVGRDNRILVGLDGRIVSFDRDARTADITPPGKKPPYLTAILWTPESLYAADSINGVVWRTHDGGATWSAIDGRAGDGSPGFVLRSQNFDLAAGRDGLLRIVNPGMLRVEVYTPDGMRLFTRGDTELTIGHFAGCCNPAHIAIAPDGSLVTAEKGLTPAKVKVFAPAGGDLPVGTLESVVVEASQFRNPLVRLDVAVDAGGRVVVLELERGGQVRLFERKTTRATAAPERKDDE